MADLSEDSCDIISSDEDWQPAMKSFMTPRSVKVLIDSDSDEERLIIDDDQDQSEGPSTKAVMSDIVDDSFSDIVEDSFETSPQHSVTSQKSDVEIITGPSKNTISCKRKDYEEQLVKIQEYEKVMLKTKNLISTVRLANLPDEGKILKERFEESKRNYLDAQEKLKLMVVEEDHKSSQSQWSNLAAGISTVQPKTFGKKGLENHTIQKKLTAETLEQLHGSLKNCPGDDNLAENPSGLKVQLMDHQKRALTWLVYREGQIPRGGILADDMGLGKTLTMLCLVLKTMEEKEFKEEDDEEEEKKFRKYDGGTLIVCPASLLHQWSGEVDSKFKRGMMSYNVYHGPKRESRPKRLADHDIVITTYSIVMNEEEKNGPLFRVRWKRIVLDEAHQIRNHKSQTSVACCHLSGRNRWALTGTPVHNKELDMYALLKFLRCSPFDDLVVWKRWVTDKSSGGGERLHTVISSLMLRRTKEELIEKGILTTMPSRNWELIPVTLDNNEMGVYQKVLIFSQTLFAQFLHQKAEKTQDQINLQNPQADGNAEYFKMRKHLLKMNKVKDVSQHEILLLLLRLRQICCHTSLITSMLKGDEDLGDDVSEPSEELNLLDQLNKLNLDEQVDEPSFTQEFAAGLSQDPVGLKEATKGLLNPSHPVFAKDRPSSKIKTMMEKIPNILSTGDKIIIVSQWSSYLGLIGIHLKKSGIKFLQLDGSVPTAKRTEIVNSFNDVNCRVRVLLLSLTAGGVGLNLVGANHLFLLDLHWNPQLENQAQDRIYRMGQKKNVFVYKLMASDTIEERIKKLQENKLAISEQMLHGTKQVVANKLSLQDLKMLFNM